MSRWLARLDAKSQQCVTKATAKTDKSPPVRLPAPLLAVLAVAQERQPQEIGDAANDEASAPLPYKGNPYLSKEAADRCHAPEWTATEIFTFTTRVMKFIRIGLRQDADSLAEMLVLRDREGDDRRLCAECKHGRTAHCPDGSPLPIGALHRCSNFEAP